MINAIEFNEDFQLKEGDAAEMMVIERPKSVLQMLKTLYTFDEFKLLRLCNADGYFYLYYLKLCGKLFALSTIH